MAESDLFERRQTEASTLAPAIKMEGEKKTLQAMLSIKS
jgi:hypothetical protein